MARSPLVRLPKPIIRGFSAMHRGMVQASGGRVGVRFRGTPVILLTTTGRKSGRPRTQPLTGLPRGDGWVVTASNGGHDEHPAWYLNLRDNPEARVREGRREVPVRARDASPAERAEQWPRFVDVLGTYAQYQEATEREIPVVFLEAVTASKGGR